MTKLHIPTLSHLLNLARADIASVERKDFDSDNEYAAYVQAVCDNVTFLREEIARQMEEQG